VLSGAFQRNLKLHNVKRDEFLKNEDTISVDLPTERVLTGFLDKPLLLR
jgi:hypothetical protein